MYIKNGINNHNNPFIKKTENQQFQFFLTKLRFYLNLSYPS